MRIDHTNFLASLTIVCVLIASSTFIGCGSANKDVNLSGSEESSISTEASAAENSSNVTTPDAVIEESVPLYSDDVITSFIWKPVSESTGNLVVLINPFNASCVVDGAITETLTNTGASNGKGSTLRGQKRGCTYGNGVKIYCFDKSGLPIRNFDGNDYVLVPGGCDRFEY